MIHNQAYSTSAQIIKEKLTLQIREWVEEKRPMIFETLTLSPENYNEKAIKSKIREYKKRLRKNTTRYLIVFEHGSKTGRGHFHAIYDQNTRLGTRSHGNWQGGTSDVRRIQYLNDGYSNQAKMLLKGYSIEKVIAYSVKYIAKDTNEIKDTDPIKYRTAMSRGFGTCKLRQKIMMESTSKLKEMAISQLPNYMKILLQHVQKELARRITPPRDKLRQDLTSAAGAPLLEIVKGKPHHIGIIKGTKRVLFKEYQEYVGA